MVPAGPGSDVSVINKKIKFSRKWHKGTILVYVIASRQDERNERKILKEKKFAKPWRRNCAMECIRIIPNDSESILVPRCNWSLGLDKICPRCNWSLGLDKTYPRLNCSLGLDSILCAMECIRIIRNNSEGFWIYPVWVHDKIVPLKNINDMYTTI